jgi:hypothetical protein
LTWTRFKVTITWDNPYVAKEKSFSIGLNFIPNSRFSYFVSTPAVRIYSARIIKCDTLPATISTLVAFAKTHPLDHFIVIAIPFVK